MKARRQSVILDVIQRQPVRNQEQLRRLVRAAGFDVTQATLSRDVRELGLVKGGAAAAYQSPAIAGANGHSARPGSNIRWPAPNRRRLSPSMAGLGRAPVH